MKRVRLAFFLMLLSVLCSAFLYGQVFTNDAGTREKHFIYEVKQIDEFFERFNNDSSSFLTEVYKSHHVKYRISRTKLIKSLFNYESNSWQPTIIDSFVKSALRIKMPTRRDFYGENWYAEANCKFQYGNTVIEIPLVLKIVTDAEERSKWMIVAAKAKGLKPSRTDTQSIFNKEKTKFTSPVSHTTNFIDLHNAFEDKENLSDYFDNSFFKKINGQTFYKAILNDDIKFLNVKDIKYHFLQVDGWIFRVEYFQRQTLNSGWLINGLRKASWGEKKEFKKTLLDGE